MAKEAAWIVDAHGKFLKFDRKFCVVKYIYFTGQNEDCC